MFVRNYVLDTILKEVIHSLINIDLMTIGISIILPTYNCEFIERSVNSVINQEYKSWELIVVDNFSKNNVKKILTKKKN